MRGPLIFLIAGESSGDQLGASLISSLREQGVSRFAGLGGSEMSRVGLDSIFPLTDISVMGLLPVIKRLPIILKRLQQTVEAIIEASPKCVVLIDSPDFTHRVAKRLRKLRPDIPIINYVSPTVWAWRSGRARTMTGYIDCVMALLPFEPAAYERLGGPRCVYVGHPLVDQYSHKQSLQVKNKKKRLIVMPGSREAEIRRMAPLYGQALDLLKDEISCYEIIVPVAANMDRFIKEEIKCWSTPCRLVSQDEKKTIFNDAHAALVTSGVATLELALCHIPMVVAYKVSYFESLLKFLIKVESIVLPNLIAQQNTVPEFIQEEATPQRLAEALLSIVKDTRLRQDQLDMFVRVWELTHTSGMRPSQQAARLVMEYI